MVQYDPNRRRFLKQMAKNTAAAPFFMQLMEIEAGFASELQQLEESGVTGDSFENIRDSYSLAKELTYWNHGSIGTIPKIVQQAHFQYLELCESNPWLYVWGGAWAQGIEQTREKAAGLLNCSADEMALTHNTTEGFNILAAGLQIGTGDEVLFSSLNHPGASICWQYQSQRRGFSVRRFEFPVSEAAELTSQELMNIYAQQITKATKVLVFPHIDNIVGFRYPVKELTELARSKGVRFVAVDGAQAVGMIGVDVANLGVDFYAASPHKWLQAPKGLGMLYLRKGAQAFVQPNWVSWGQERWSGSVRVFEDYGTRNQAAVLALGHAIDFQNALGADNKMKRHEWFWQRFKEHVESQNRVVWRSPTHWGSATPLFAIEIRDTDSNVFSEEFFKQHGFVFRPFKTPNLNTLRISANVFNSEAEIDRFFDLVSKL